MFYYVEDIMQILGIAHTKAYEIIRNLADDLAKTKVPGKEITYCKPPAGRIQKAYFCERFALNVSDCDVMLSSRKELSA
jgi:hypothetical protein